MDLFKILLDFAWFPWIFQDSVGFSQDFHVFSRILLDFARFYKKFLNSRCAANCNQENL